MCKIIFKIITGIFLGLILIGKVGQKLHIGIILILIYLKIICLIIKGGASFKINGSVDRFFQGLNYFGSSNEATINENIIDYFEDNGLGVVYLGSNYLTEPSEGAHGIVWKVEVNGYDAQDEYALLDPLGVGDPRV